MVLVRPNREKPASKATKAAVVLLLVVSAALIFLVTIGGWSAQSSIKLFSLFVAALYLLMAYYVLRWSRGMLALAAGMAIVFAIIALISVRAWFARDAPGFDDPLLPAGLLGLLTLVLVPVQLLLIGFSVRGFNQQWNVEVEVSRDEAEEGVAGKFDQEGKRIEDPDEDEGGEAEHSADGGEAYDDPTGEHAEEPAAAEEGTSEHTPASGGARNPHAGQGPDAGDDGSETRAS